MVHDKVEERITPGGRSTEHTVSERTTETWDTRFIPTPPPVNPIGQGHHQVQAGFGLTPRTAAAEREEDDRIVIISATAFVALVVVCAVAVATVCMCQRMIRVS